MDEGFEEILRLRLDTLSKIKEARNEANDDLGVVVLLLWSKELILFQSRRGLEIEDLMILALKFFFHKILV